MSTYLEVRTDIATELDRTDLSTDLLKRAVQRAIKRYEGERLYFNEARDLTFNTVAAQALYTVSDAPWIPTLVRLDDPGILVVGGQNRDIHREDALELEYLSDNSASQGEPYSWAYYGQELRLYPIPDQVYSVRFYGVKRLSTLVDDNDENSWTTDAEDLIVAGAKRWLCQQVLRDMQMAEVMKMAEDEALMRLRSEHYSRVATGTVQSMAF